MDVQFLHSYADLLVKYCLEFKPVSANSKTIVYFVPSECAEVKPFLVDQIEKSSYTAIDKERIQEQLAQPVIYLEVVGDNLVKPLYSQEFSRPKYFEKEHVLLSPFPTAGRAALAGVSQAEYIAEFKRIYFLNEPDPLAAWKNQLSKVSAIKNDLNALHIQKLEVVSPSIQLSLSLSEQTKWLGASGRNLPSAEVFTSPDWRTVQGKILFNVPMNKYGFSIKNIRCQIENGIITSYSCDNDQEQLDQILGQKNMLKVGEFSLTDKHISPINTYMANGILDENTGGEFGNLHLALGKSYQKAYSHFKPGLNAEELNQIGYNDSADHIDFINTEAKEVFGWNEQGKFLLYKDGTFQY